MYINPRGELTRLQVSHASSTSSSAADRPATTSRSMGLLPLFLRAVARLAACLATRPVSETAATVLYHAGALPRDPALERLVCDDMLDGGGDDDCILHFVVGVMRSLG